MLNNYQDFKALQLELLKFSKHLKFDEEKEGISCPIAIQKLQKEKNKEGVDKKYVIALIIFEGKVVRTFQKYLHEFDIKLFTPYMHDKKKLRVVVYLFDTRYEYENLNNFLNMYFTNKSILQKIKKFVLNHIPALIGVGYIIISAVMLYVIYLGLGAYGISTQKSTGIQEIFFLVSIVFVLIIISLSLYFVFVMFLFLLFIPVLTKFLGKRSIKWNLQRLHSETKEVLVLISMAIPILFILLFIGRLFIFPAYLSIFQHDFSKHKGNEVYGLVMQTYRDYYSGYPKILIDKAKENKVYYVPFEASGKYYVYDVDEVSKRYLEDENNIPKNVQEICNHKKARKEFIDSYIINNPYIKSRYQSKTFSIDDKNVTLEEFNMSKIFSDEDINRTLCSGKMK